MGVSGRQLADIIGVSEAAVRKAAKAGRIKKLADGTYDPDEARRAWGKTTDPARSAVRVVREPANPAPISTEDDAREAVSLITRILQEEGGIATGVVDFDAARTAETILKARERAINIETKQQRLVPADEVAKYVGNQFVKYRQAVQRIPARFSAQMAGEIGCDPHQLDAALSKVIASVLNELAAPNVRSSAEH